MATKVKDADIDPSGVFKYILIKLTTKDGGGKALTKDIVRGYKACKFHTDINDKVVNELENLKKDGDFLEYESKVLGGGKINHDSAAKTLKVYSESQGYGKADHKISVEILKKAFPGYNITWSNEVD